MVTEVGDKPVKRLANPLLPDRFQQPDLFICDIFDAAPKSDMAGMEHPVFSISKKPDHQTRRYENGENYIEISPSAKGMATVNARARTTPNKRRRGFSSIRAAAGLSG